ncbi:MAG: hypothetical protein FD164_2108 [Nitrospirae bacterium]|nr:MAG: hypothetical protein FD164_2108 [Nitrospirota bacterium]
MQLVDRKQLFDFKQGRDENAGKSSGKLCLDVDVFFSVRRRGFLLTGFRLGFLLVAIWPGRLSLDAKARKRITRAGPCYAANSIGFTNAFIGSHDNLLSADNTLS